MSPRKAFFICLLVIIGSVLILILEWWVEYGQYLPDTFSLEPSEINEPMKTWHVGALAFEAPESLGRPLVTGVFHPGEQWDTPLLEFFEEERPANADPASAAKPPMPRDRFEMLMMSWNRSNSKPEKLGQEDVSLILGSPAGLAAYFYSQPTVFEPLPSRKEFESAYQRRLRKRAERLKKLWNDIRTKFEGPKIVDENSYFLRLSAVVNHGEGRLRFTSTEQLEQPYAPDFTDAVVQQHKEAFLKKISDFLAVYHWTGRNEPPAANQLATRLGYIDISKGWLAPGLELSTIFSFESGPERERHGSHTLTAWHFQDRSSSGRLGRKLPRVVSNDTFVTVFGLNITEEKRQLLDIDDHAAVWANLEIIAFPKNLVPFPPSKDIVYYSYDLGVFYSMYNSIRVSGEHQPD